MITILGRANSSNVQLVMWAIGELGLEYQRQDFGHVHGGTDTPEYLDMNPNGRVPVMIDGDLTMFESGAIARYLCARHGTAPFWPGSLEARGRLDMWCEWIKVTLAPLWAQPVFWALLSHPRGEGGDAVRPATDAIKPLMKILDARIGAGPWLAGDDFTFGDLWAGHLLFRYQSLVFDKADTPHLDAYYHRLTERPAFAEHVMVDFEPLRRV